VLQLCYADLVANSVTSSFRISETLRLRLEATARQLGKRKNWVINRALEEYLTKTHRASLAKEARRQSLLASRVTTADERFWMDEPAAEDWT
jgi:predicted DNA-binding protein